MKAFGNSGKVRHAFLPQLKISQEFRNDSQKLHAQIDFLLTDFECWLRHD